MAPPPHNGVQVARPKGREQPEDADQAIVSTPYGRGLVTRTRKSDGVRSVQLLEWESVAKPRKRQPFMMYTPESYPSVRPHVGDDVVCQYGRGTVTQIASTADAKGALPMKYEIALSSWRLNGRTAVTCHVTWPPPRVVRKHTLSEMDAHEKVALAGSQKIMATKYFSQGKDYALALTTFASAVDAVRNVQHDHTSTNVVRADLVMVMVTCCNNAATCSIKLRKWDEARQFGQNALILLDALYGKRGKKIHTILNQEGTIDAKLFGEWRIKSYLVMARSSIEEGAVADAMGILRKAWGIAMGYVNEIKEQHQLSKEEKSSLKSLTSQVKEIRRTLVECSDKKKSAKKIAQRRAKAMFGDAKENPSPNSVHSKRKMPVQKINREEDKESHIVDVSTKPQIAGISAVNGQVNNKRKGSMSTREERQSHPTARKSVSFSEQLTQVKDLEPSGTGKADSSLWYLEHKEALIMLAVAGISAATVMSLRRSFK